MRRSIVAFILVLSAVAQADTPTERKCQATISTLTAQLAVATKATAELRQKLDAANAARDAHNNVSTQIKEQNKTHAEEAGAVTQAQMETTDTLDTSVKNLNHQIEFEKQLAALQVDLHKVVSLQRDATYLLILMFALMLSFTGGVVYTTRRRRDDARTE